MYSYFVVFPKLFLLGVVFGVIADGYVRVLQKQQQLQRWYNS